MTIKLTEEELELIIDGLNYCIMYAEGSQATARAVWLKEKLIAGNDSYNEKPDAFDESNNPADYEGLK